MRQESRSRRSKAASAKPPRPRKKDGTGRRRQAAKDFRAVAYGILDSATRGPLRHDFLSEVSSMLLDFSQSDILELLFQIAVIHRSTQVSLRERVKELTCLYGIAQVVARHISLEEVFQSIVELLPAAWLHADKASAMILLDGRFYSTPNFHEDGPTMAADIIVAGVRRGTVKVAYGQKLPDIDEGPFLKEERHLINTIARELALIVERRHAEEDKEKFEEQLRHADRLATIGQLATGLVHELNEPLGSILGFAQLAGKCEHVPTQAQQDIDKIVSASLYARDVIQRFLSFGRQAPPNRTRLNLNAVVKEGMSLIDSRCHKKGIKVVCTLSPELPDIHGEAVQLHQVVVNLVVNAVQAMPNGGTLKIETRPNVDHVELVVEDTGVGMSEDVRTKLFIPFFTTKGTKSGTGIGLPVVHGIVTSHGGSINVESEIGRGARFEIRLPVAAEPQPK